MKTTEELLELIPKFMTLGKTLFSNPEKKYVVCHEAWLLSEYFHDIQVENLDLIEFQQDALDNRHFFYGKTPQEALNKCYNHYNKVCICECEIF